MMRSIRFLAMLLACCGLLAGTALAAGGSRSPMPETSTSAEPEKTPEQLAVEHYNRGLTYRDQAWKLEKKLEAATEEKQRTKLEKKIRNAYTRAAREFRDSIDNIPTMFQAHSSLGYALRKTGEFEDSLAAYDRALQLNPGYTEAIEYRAEAYLGLNRIEEAKQAYVTLFGNDRERADELMAAMKKWLEHRRHDGGGVDSRTIASFEAWVAEREEIAKQTAALRPDGDKKGW
jgi:tetratricopeptide (TPR) repeat protein